MIRALILFVSLLAGACVVGPFTECNTDIEGCMAGIEGRMQDEFYIDENGIRWGTTTTTIPVAEPDPDL